MQNQKTSKAMKNGIIFILKVDKTPTSIGGE